MRAFRLYDYVGDPIDYLLAIAGFLTMNHRSALGYRRSRRNRLSITMVVLVAHLENTVLFRRFAAGLPDEKRARVGGETRER